MAERGFGLILALVGLMAGVGLAMFQRSPSTTALAPRPPVTATSTIEVHVVGWVGAPGVVSVPHGSLVVDAIVAAGGLRRGARVDAVNLAAGVEAGQQVVVPGPDEGTVTPEGGGDGTGPLDINRATAAELETLPGVGPVLAARILSYRDQYGPFRQIEDLLGVSGIGEAKLAALRDLITVR